ASSILADLTWSRTAGTIVLDSSSGPTGVTLRAGGFVVVPAVRDQVTSARIDEATNGSFRISSLDGTVAVIPLEGTSGQILQVGQSVSISPRGELPSPALAQPESHTHWILLGLAGAGASAAAGACGCGACWCRSECSCRRRNRGSRRVEAVCQPLITIAE